MLNNKEIKAIINDVTGSIVLITEEEGSCIINLHDFLIDNFDLIVLGNSINAKLEDVKKIDLLKVINNLLLNNFNIYVKDNNYKLNKSNYNSNKYLKLDLIISK